MDKSKLTALDRRILDRLQKDIPFTTEPWKRIAVDFDISQKLLLERIKALKKKGLIRRISATFNPKRVGFVSTLVALKVIDKNIKPVVNKINCYREVTHNYRRDSEYNIWFTLVAPGKNRIKQIMRQLRKSNDIEEILDLPAIRLFKINVNFKV